MGRMTARMIANTRDPDLAPILGPHPGHHPAYLAILPSYWPSSCLIMLSSCKDDSSKQKQNDPETKTSNIGNRSPQNPHLALFQPIILPGRMIALPCKMNHPGLGLSSCPMYKSADLPIRIGPRCEAYCLLPFGRPDLRE